MTRTLSLQGKSDEARQVPLRKQTRVCFPFNLSDTNRSECREGRERRAITWMNNVSKENKLLLYPVTMTHTKQKVNN